MTVTLQKTCCAFLNTAFLWREQLQEDSSTLLDWILKQCRRDRQIIPLMLFTTDFVPFLLRLNSDVGKGKMQVKRKTQLRRKTYAPAQTLHPKTWPNEALAGGGALQTSPWQTTAAELAKLSPSAWRARRY